MEHFPDFVASEKPVPFDENKITHQLKVNEKYNEFFGKLLKAKKAGIKEFTHVAVSLDFYEKTKSNDELKAFIQPHVSEAITKFVSDLKQKNYPCEQTIVHKVISWHGEQTNNYSIVLKAKLF